MQRILASTFYDRDAGPYNGYLVDPLTGRATADTFERDASSFRIHIRELRSLDSASMNVTLVSESADGTAIDAIQRYDCRKGAARGPVSLRQSRLQDYESAQRILAVMDRVDDGAEGAVDANNQSGFRFSPNDGKENDQTIQTEIGGRLRVVYTDRGLTQEAKVDICPAGVRLTLPVKVYLVEGVSDNPSAALDEARRYWAQLCVDLQQVGGVETIPDPTGQLRRLVRATAGAYYYDTETGTEVDCLNDAYKPSDSNPKPLPLPAVCKLEPGKWAAWKRFERDAPSAEMLRLISAAPLPAGETLLRIIVVDRFETRLGDRTVALGYAATTDVATVRAFTPTSAGLEPLSVQESGVLFVAKNANGQSWAHEIAHAVVGEVEVPERCDDRVHVDCSDERPNILWPQNRPLNAVDGKRFNGRQVDLLYRSNRYVRYPSPGR